MGFKAFGRIIARGKVEVVAGNGPKQIVETKNIVIATGSEVAPLRDADGNEIAIDEKTILSSTGALALEKVPQRLAIVGAGVIGLELGSVWGRLGAKINVIEFLDRILPGYDAGVALNSREILEKQQGFVFNLGCKVTRISKGKKSVTVSYAAVAGGDEQTIEADAVLIATGRIPFTKGLGLEDIGVALERGRVVIDDHFQTNVPGVYAIGDVVRGPMLARKSRKTKGLRSRKSSPVRRAM